MNIQSIKIDGESVYIFDSAIYLFESSSGYTLELMMIVSEVVLMKYKNAENLIVEIELKDGRLINMIMHLQILSGDLPKLHLYCEVDELEEYHDICIVREENPVFPVIGETITLTEIRQYEMPNEKIRFNLHLPVDQAEWIATQKKSTIQNIVKEAIYKYWEKGRG